jgi:hypothetical protein
MKIPRNKFPGSSLKRKLRTESPVKPRVYTPGTYPNPKTQNHPGKMITAPNFCVMGNRKKTLRFIRAAHIIHPLVKTGENYLKLAVTVFRAPSSRNLKKCLRTKVSWLRDTSLPAFPSFYAFPRKRSVAVLAGKRMAPYGGQSLDHSYGIAGEFHRAKPDGHPTSFEIRKINILPSVISCQGFFQKSCRCPAGNTGKT